MSVKRPGWRFGKGSSLALLLVACCSAAPCLSSSFVGDSKDVDDGCAGGRGGWGWARRSGGISPPPTHQAGPRPHGKRGDCDVVSILAGDGCRAACSAGSETTGPPRSHSCAEKAASGFWVSAAFSTDDRCSGIGFSALSSGKISRTTCLPLAHEERLIPSLHAATNFPTYAGRSLLLLGGPQRVLPGGIGALVLLFARALAWLPVPAALLARAGEASRGGGFSTFLLGAALVAAGGVRPAEAFTCPSGCTCGSASSVCASYAVGNGAVVATCAQCTGMSAIPTLTSDTSALYLYESPSLAPVISAAGFQFPASWSALKGL
jgi:hypothetical protein